MQAPDLITEAESLLEQAKARVDKLKAVEPTQLRIVTNRLRLFLEQHPEPNDEPEASEEAEATPAASKRRSKPKADETPEPEASGE